MDSFFYQGAKGITVCQRGNVISTGAVCGACAAHFCAYLFFRAGQLINFVGFNAALECNLALGLLLELHDIIGSQGALPNVNMAVDHILNDGFVEAVGVMNYDNALIMKVAIHAFVLRLENIAPQLGRKNRDVFDPQSS